MVHGNGDEIIQTGAMIKKYLENNGISQTFISKQTGIKLPKLNLALNGKRRITVDEYFLICVSLGLNADYFFNPSIWGK